MLTDQEIGRLWTESWFNSVKFARTIARLTREEVQKELLNEQRSDRNDEKPVA